MSLDAQEIAASVLSAVGGLPNVIANSTCMTRLRITVVDLAEVDVSRINALDPVLGCVERGVNGIEVIFGPRTIRPIYEAFAELTGLASSIEPLIGSRRPAKRLNVHIAPASSQHEKGAKDVGNDDSDLLGSLPNLLDGD